VIYTNSINSVISIVLDEIHSIGQQEGGAIWEQILLLAPCPIMFVS
jgi:superfamily II RNA helicase